MQIVLADILYKTDKRSLFGNAIQGGGGDDPTTTNDDETEEETDREHESIYLKRLYLFISTQHQIKSRITTNFVILYSSLCLFSYKSSNQFSCS